MQPGHTDRPSESTGTIVPPTYSTDGHPPLEPGTRTGDNRSVRSWRRWPLVIATVLFVLVQLGPWLLGSLGLWLVVEDEVGDADVIFVHSGGIPFRAMEAAELYRSGHAPEVWIASLRPSDRSRALERLGVRMPGPRYWQYQVLQRLGIPSDAIRVLEEQVMNTSDEIDAVRSEMRRLDRSSVILVTSKVHSRRVHTLWNQADDPSIVGTVRWSRADPFDPAQWWTNTTDGEDVIRELAGLVNAWTGAGWRPERE